MVDVGLGLEEKVLNVGLGVLEEMAVLMAERAGEVYGVARAEAEVRLALVARMALVAGRGGGSVGSFSRWD